MKKLLVLVLLVMLTLPALAEMGLTEADFTLRLTEAEDAPVYLIGEDAAALLAGLEALTGAEVSLVFEDADCMLPGMTREYATADEGVVLATRPLPGDPDANSIESILVLTPEIATIRGARVGMTLANVEVLYGPPSAVDYDTALYTQGEFAPQILFYFDPDTQVVTGWMLLRNMVI